MSRKLTRIAVLGVLLSSVLAFGMRGVPAAHATPAQSSGPRAGAPSPNIITDTCITVTFTDATVITTNTAQIKGTIHNGCPFNLANGRFESYAHVSCPGPGVNITIDGTDFLNLPSMTPNETLGITGQQTGRCEVCVNGVPTAFPPFNLDVDADATGSNSAGNIQADSNVPIITVHGLPNSSNYAFPCP